MEQLDLIEKMRLILRHEVLYFSLDKPRQEETLDALEWLNSEENCELVLDDSVDLPKRIWVTRTVALKERYKDVFRLTNVISF